MRSKVCVITASGKRVCGTRTTKASGSAAKHRVTSREEAERLGAIAGARTAEAHARQVAGGAPEFQSEQQIRSMHKTWKDWAKQSASGHDVQPISRLSFGIAYVNAFVQKSIDLYRERRKTNKSLMGRYMPDHDDDGYVSDRENFYGGSGMARPSGSAPVGLYGTSRDIRTRKLTATERTAAIARYARKHNYSLDYVRNSDKRTAAIAEYRAARAARDDHQYR